MRDVQRRGRYKADDALDQQASSSSVVPCRSPSSAFLSAPYSLFCTTRAGSFVFGTWCLIHSLLYNIQTTLCTIYHARRPPEPSTVTMKSVAMKSVLLGALGIASATYHPDEAKNEWKMDHNTGNVAGEAKNDWKMDHKTENVAGEAAEWNAVDMPYEAPKADVKLAPEHMLEGAKDNENVYVVAANWGGDNGETKVADPSAGGATHEVLSRLSWYDRAEELLIRSAGRRRRRRARLHPSVDRCGSRRQGPFQLHGEEPQHHAVELR